MTVKPSKTAAGNPSRRHQPTWVLEPRSIRLLDRLPTEMRLLGLRRSFPHVINEIALHWNSPDDMQRTMQSLLIDERGSREGFPADVRQELAELANYYFTEVRPELAEAR